MVPSVLVYISVFVTSNVSKLSIINLGVSASAVHVAVCVCVFVGNGKDTKTI